MRTFFIFILIGLATTHFFGQTNTEIYLCTIAFEEDGFHFSELQNISNNNGYNNQPCFLNTADIVYARNHKGQPDIGIYSLDQKSTIYFNAPTEGGEYSPQTIPNSKDIAAVRLDPNGKQRLYRYRAEKNGIDELIPEVEVAYFAFMNESEILASILGLNQLDLVHIDLNSGTVTPMVSNSGRCIQKIPGTQLMSYTVLNEQKNFDIYQYDPETKESFFVCELPIGIQDYTWYEDYKIIIGSGTQLFVYDLFGDAEWQEIGNLKLHGFNNITRLTLSPDNRHLAFAAESIN